MTTRVSGTWKRTIAAVALAWALGCGGGEAEERSPEEPGLAEARAELRFRAASDREAASGAHAVEVEGEVHLTERQMEQLGIRVEPLPSSSSSTIRRPATLRLDPDLVALVGPRIRAKVERVLVDLGDVVRPGTPLAILSSVELGTAKAAYLTAAARLHTRKAEYEREERLFRDRISSEAELLEARARFHEAEAELEASRETLRLYGLSLEEIEAIGPGAEEPLSFFRLLSPASGMVQRRELSPGQTLDTDAAPVQIARVDRLWLMIDAYERDLPLLEEGQVVSLSVRSLPGESFEAVIDWISYELDPETRTVQVRAVAANRDGLLRAGMFGTVEIAVERGESRALVPVDAVQTLEGRPVLFVPGDEPGSFRPRPVRLGNEFDGQVEIAEGASPGEPAVVAGAFELLSAATAEGREAEH